MKWNKNYAKYFGILALFTLGATTTQAALADVAWDQTYDIMWGDSLSYETGSLELNGIFESEDGNIILQIEGNPDSLNGVKWSWEDVSNGSMLVNSKTGALIEHVNPATTFPNKLNDPYYYFTSALEDTLFVSSTTKEIIAVLDRSTIFSDEFSKFKFIKSYPSNKILLASCVYHNGNYVNRVAIYDLLSKELVSSHTLSLPVLNEDPEIKDVCISQTGNIYILSYDEKYIDEYVYGGMVYSSYHAQSAIYELKTDGNLTQIYKGNVDKPIYNLALRYNTELLFCVNEDGALLFSNSLLKRYNMESGVTDTLSGNTGSTMFVSSDNDIYLGYYSSLKKISTENVSIKETNNISEDISLSNYPNPFNPTTTISFSLPTTENVNISVYNIKGQKITTLYDNTANAGTTSLDFNASKFASGVYFYRLTTPNNTMTRKMILIK